MTRQIVDWYLRTHFRLPGDPGMPEMYFDRQAVGYFAVPREEFAAGKPAALFRMLVASTMFQRRQDAQVLRILFGISAHEVRELTTASRLRALAASSGCRFLESTAALRDGCDLTKHPVTKAGTCAANPSVSCHLKRHTVLLKRYGHFGKVPTSCALSLRELGALDLGQLREQIFQQVDDPHERAVALERALSRAWRVDSKIASMFLAVLTNPDLSEVPPPWAAGVDWEHFVVIDSNVDIFLRRVRYPGPWTYEARRAFLRALAERIDLRELNRGLHARNARLVQQAAYRFFGKLNRVRAPNDCMHQGKAACGACPAALRRLCPVRSC